MAFRKNIVSWLTNTYILLLCSITLSRQANATFGMGVKHLGKRQSNKYFITLWEVKGVKKQLACVCSVRISSICEAKTKILYYKYDEHIIFFQYEINMTFKIQANGNGKMSLGSKHTFELKNLEKYEWFGSKKIHNEEE